MGNLDDLAALDATGQADLVRRKDVKPVELVDAAIDRIERVNGAINAVVTPMYEQAREAAAGPIQRRQTAQRLSIAFSTRTPLGAHVHPDCVAAVRDAAGLCASLGHDVIEAAPRFDGELLWRSFTTVLAAGFAWGVADWARRTGRPAGPEFFEPFVWAFTERGRRLGAADYLLALQDLQRMTRDIARFFVDRGVWLTPTLGEPPVPLGTFGFSGQDPLEVRRRMAAFSPFAYVSNVTGQPAMSVPLCWNPAGLPVGTHFVGRFGDEATLLRLASQLEAVRPWAGDGQEHLVPPVRTVDVARPERRRGSRRPRGRPSHAPLVRYRSFQYQAASWDRPRRVIAKVEHHLGELFPRVGFIVTTLTRTNRAVVRFYTQRGTAEQWIKEGKAATHWTRLSCHGFRANEVRLLLGVIAYNLGNLLRRLVLPPAIQSWSLTSLQQRLFKTGGRLIRHARYFILQLAESHLTQRLFGQIFGRIERLTWHPT